MIVDEALTENGEALCYTLVEEAPGFALYEGETRVGLFSVKILCDVIGRYARPLEDDANYAGERLVLNAEVSLLAWHYKSPVDLENKLYLVMLREGQPPTAVLSRQVVSALRFVSRPATP